MIKNYTTKVDVYTSIGEIQAALARSGASIERNYAMYTGKSILTEGE